LNAVRKAGDDLTSWLEYTAAGLEDTLNKVWKRIQRLSIHSGAPRLRLRPRQEQLLQALKEKGPLLPAEIWRTIGVSRQGAMDLLKPLLEAGIVIKEGTRKTGYYRLSSKP